MSDADKKVWSDDLRNKYGIAEVEAPFEPMSPEEYRDSLGYTVAVFDDPQHGE